MEGDDTALLHFGYIVDFTKALKYAEKHNVLRDPNTGRAVDWSDKPDWMKDEHGCMYQIVRSFSNQTGFIFRYARVMNSGAFAHVVSVYSNQEMDIQRGLRIQRTMRLLFAIEEAFEVDNDELPMWWWDAVMCGIGCVHSTLLEMVDGTQRHCRYQCRLAQYNPPPPPPPPTRKLRARGLRLAEEAQLQAQLAQLYMS